MLKSTINSLYSYYMKQTHRLSSQPISKQANKESTCGSTSESLAVWSEIVSSRWSGNRGQFAPYVWLQLKHHSFLVMGRNKDDNMICLDDYSHLGSVYSICTVKSRFSFPPNLAGGELSTGNNKDVLGRGWALTWVALACMIWVSDDDLKSSFWN